MPRAVADELHGEKSTAGRRQYWRWLAPDRRLGQSIARVPHMGEKSYPSHGHSLVVDY